MADIPAVISTIPSTVPSTIPSTKAPEIQFLAYQKPALETGRFQIKLQQTVKPNPKTKDIFTQNLDFVVLGERFTLNPNAIHAMFPPAGSFGRHSDCLPHISINQSTLPWERSAYDDDDFEPWLALLLFDEQEFENEEVKESVVTLAQLQSSLSPAYKMNLEPGQLNTDKTTVIDINPALLKKIMPSGEELKLQAHVRKNADTELAVIIANRLPRAGAASVMHLVSVEGRFGENKNFNYHFNYHNNKGKGNKNTNKKQAIRLVSLKSWGFSCQANDGDNFESLVESIHSGSLRLPSRLSSKTASKAASATGALAEKFLANGYVPLPHKLRQCDRTYSWYRGPLAPHQVNRQFNAALPEFADALTRYHQDIGMFDVSYSAAYELGRSLALEDQLFCADIYRWKHQYNENICDQLQQSAAQLLVSIPVADDIAVDELAEKIKLWLGKLAQLEDIPFNYLVADDKLLKEHSIGFFKVDQHWIESLLYGAFSVGGQLREKTPNDGTRLNVFNDFVGHLFDQPRSGFFVRSSLVSDYPDLLVAAFSQVINSSAPLNASALDSALTNIRTERLGAEVLFCLFEGNVATAELYLKPEGLHYGLDEEQDQNQDQDQNQNQNQGTVQRKKELTTEYLFNAVKNHLPSGTAITTNLAAIKQQVAAKTLFYTVGLDDPATDGGKFEFTVNFKAGAQPQRVLDITAVAKQLNQILRQTAVTMTGLAEKELPEMVKTLSSAQFGLHMLEGSNKGRFVLGDNL